MAAAVILIGFGAVLTQLDLSTALIALAALAAGLDVLAADSGVLRKMRRQSLLTMIGGDGEPASTLAPPAPEDPT